MNADNIERDKFQFEKEKYERDFQLKEREFSLREMELKNGRLKTTPTYVAILVALVGVSGTYLGAFIQSYSNQKIETAKLESLFKLEDKKLESEMILKAVHLDSIERSKKGLKFMLNAGFLPDDQGKLNRLVNHSEFDLKTKNRSVICSLVPNTKWLQYKNISVAQIVEQLAELYGMGLLYFKNNMPNNRINIKFVENCPLSEILESISTTCNIEFRIISKTIVIRPKDILSEDIAI